MSPRIDRYHPEDDVRQISEVLPPLLEALDAARAALPPLAQQRDPRLIRLTRRLSILQDQALTLQEASERELKRADR